MNLNPQGAQGIAESCDSIAVSPVKLAEDVFRGPHRHTQTARIAALLICIQKGASDEAGADQVRRSSRHYDGARLPRKTVPPAPIGKALRPKGNEPLDHLFDETSLVKLSNPR